MAVRGNPRDPPLSHIWPRAPNPDGEFWSALKAVERDRADNWSAADVAARMDFCLRTAYAHGTSAVRTHLDSVDPQIAISWPVAAKMRELWRGRIELQAAPLFSIEFAFDSAHMAAIEQALEASGFKILGAVTFMIPSGLAWK